MLPVIHHGALPLIYEGPTENLGDDGELDAVSLNILLDSTPSGGWRAALAAAGYARKTKLTGWNSIWVRSANLIHDNGTTAEVAVQAIGLLATGEKRKRTISSNSSTISTQPLPSHEVTYKDAYITLTDTYFVTGATPPDTTVIGTILTPPNPPSTPPRRAISLAESFRIFIPAGWLLDNREIEPLFTAEGDGLWQVTDIFGYYPPLPDPE
jgi:hypothetical protein